MSTRTVLRPNTVLSNGDMSLASVATTPTLLQGLSQFCYYVQWSGSSPVGTLELQFSGDYALDNVGGVANPGTWTTAPTDLGQTIAISGNTGNGGIDVETSANAVRLLYTKGSGSGVLSVIISGRVK